jgi:hypothetical protein
VTLVGHAPVQRGPGDPGREVRSILGEGAEPQHHGQEARQVRRRPPRRELVEHAPRYLVELVEDDLATHDRPPWARNIRQVPGLPTISPKSKRNTVILPIQSKSFLLPILYY